MQQHQLLQVVALVVVEQRQARGSEACDFRQGSSPCCWACEGAEGWEAKSKRSHQQYKVQHHGGRQER